ncbi:hypothetical protein ThvES_00008110 [Thiovulum sp. ES]|nr:hypothetical protein ThvES_00008110 [Thiovulum sp. ES]
MLVNHKGYLKHISNKLITIENHKEMVIIGLILSNLSEATVSVIVKVSDIPIIQIELSGKETVTFNDKIVLVAGDTLKLLINSPDDVTYMLSADLSNV